MGIPIVLVDAFTDTLFAGNPAAVCLLTETRPDSWMQGTAREMNLSETAFLVPRDDGLRLRWFTPAVEVELCGHATLVSTHVLWSAPTYYARVGGLARTSRGEVPHLRVYPH